MAVWPEEMVGRGKVVGSNLGEKGMVGWYVTVGLGGIVGFVVVVGGLLWGDLGT